MAEQTNHLSTGAQLEKVYGDISQLSEGDQKRVLSVLTSIIHRSMSGYRLDLSDVLETAPGLIVLKQLLNNSFIRCFDIYIQQSEMSDVSYGGLPWGLGDINKEILPNGQTKDFIGDNFTYNNINLVDNDPTGRLFYSFDKKKNSIKFIKFIGAEIGYDGRPGNFVVIDCSFISTAQGEEFKNFRNELIGGIIDILGGLQVMDGMVNSSKGPGVFGSLEDFTHSYAKSLSTINTLIQLYTILIDSTKYNSQKDLWERKKRKLGQFAAKLEQQFNDGETWRNNKQHS